MPTLEGPCTRPYSTISAMAGQAISIVQASFLKEALRNPESNQVLVFDCRSPADYSAAHVRGALNVTLPSLMLRRLASGRLSLLQVLSYFSPQDASTIRRLYTCVPLILYDHAHMSEELPSNSLLMALWKRLVSEGCNAHVLGGGFEAFQESFPEWCESSHPVHPDPPIMGLTSLRISPITTSGGSFSGVCDSSLGRETPYDDLCFPVEILPHLFLGNAQNSGDRDALNRHKIRYIVNVTNNLPNVFEGHHYYKYMQIPIADHWDENLALFFPKAFQFIDEAREKGVGVLVHCLAGISRSVTITVAYLMYKEKLSLEEAYEYVRLKKANIAPNFNFMGQLQDFQQQLKLSPQKCQCMSECRCRPLHFMSPTGHTSPDSGIEFDRHS